MRLDVVGIAVKDMAVSLQFYRLLGLTVPGGAESKAHVEVDLGSVRLAWDSIGLLDRTPKEGLRRVGGALGTPHRARVPVRRPRRRGCCLRADDVARVPPPQGSIGCGLGTTIRHCRGSGRQPPQSLRLGARGAAIGCGHRPPGQQVAAPADVVMSNLL